MLAADGGKSSREETHGNESRTQEEVWLVTMECAQHFTSTHLGLGYEHD